jgi:hypothetical protein
MTQWQATTHVVCIGKPIGPKQQKFTEVGVAWDRGNGKFAISLDVTLILGPNDNIYIFPKNDKNRQGDETK